MYFVHIGEESCRVWYIGGFCGFHLWDSICKDFSFFFISLITTKHKTSFTVDSMIVLTHK